MKKLITITAILFTFYASAQKSDTLTITVGKYQFVRVGDKVYKLITTLEEVPAYQCQYWRLTPSDIKVDSMLFYDGEKLVPGTPEGLWMFKPMRKLRDKSVKRKFVL